MFALDLDDVPPAVRDEFAALGLTDCLPNVPIGRLGSVPTARTEAVVEPVSLLDLITTGLSSPV